MSPARQAAFQILLLVEKGGYASDLLAGRTQDLDARDAGLATRIVYGCLRRQAQLDFLIQNHARRAASSLDTEVRLALRMGLYQLLHLERVPPHAAVSESVELVRRAKKASAAGFVNAILRKAGRSGPPAWPDRATELSVPGWLLARWEEQFGERAAAGIARAFLDEPETHLRVPARAPVEGIDLEPTSVAGCFRLKSGESGGFRIQDIG